MRIRCIIVVLFFIFISFSKTNAEVVNIDDAKKVGKSFFYERLNQYQSIEFNDIEIGSTIVREHNSLAVFYVFNVKPNGYVIVSGEDIVHPILGYSFEGNYSGENMPISMEGWIQNYVDQIVYLRENNIPATDEIKNEWKYLLTNNSIDLKSSKAKSVTPLLLDTWNQDKFYNELCPADQYGSGGHAYAGCVATAMSQIMFYYKYPTSGSGTHSYYSPYGLLTAHFGNATYDYNSMVNDIGNKSNLEIAELMYHCGVSVNMNYSSSGSGANTNTARKSMRDYFNYSSNISQKQKYSYTNSNWISLLKSNLDSERPMLYSGYPSGGGSGHAWVCDGYQSTNHFHFNWGWGGAYNGYFYVSNLNPGSYNFNSSQKVIVNIYPANNYPNYCSASKTLTSSEGVIFDGSGPSDYENNLNCSWLIDPVANVDNITLSFERFATEASNDVVTVYDGQTTSDPVLGTFSGSSLPSSVTSTGDKMLIIFSSNGSVVSDGFDASFRTTLSKFCDGMVNLTNQSDTFNDGSGSLDYNPSTICKWMVEPTAASTVTLIFTAFDTEPTNDFIKIYDPTTTPGTLLAEFSGSTIPPPVTSPSGKMYVLFFTNGNQNEAGWEAYYTTAFGLNENIGIQDLSVFPNPSNDYFNISYSSIKKQELIINIIDVTGKIFYTKDVSSSVGENKYNLNLSSLSQGIYILRISGSDFVINKKIAIQ